MILRDIREPRTANKRLSRSVEVAMLLAASVAHEWVIPQLAAYPFTIDGQSSEGPHAKAELQQSADRPFRSPARFHSAILRMIRRRSMLHPKM
jgi:hypothetical protein